jgi:hypothetical protein
VRRILEEDFTKRRAELRMETGLARKIENAFGHGAQARTLREAQTPKRRGALAGF